MSKIRGFLLLSGLGIVTVLSANRGAASKLYHFTGEVTEVGKDTVSVRRGVEEVEFARPKHLGDIKKGDRITVFYNLEAKQIKSSTQSGGQSGGSAKGEAAPSETAPDEHIILDDRAFYNAKNQAHPRQKDPS